MNTVSTVISTVSYSDYSFINRVILPGGGRKYSGIHSKGLVWLKNKGGNYFPNHFLRRESSIIILYAHGNGGSLGDFKSAVLFYGRNLNVSFFAVEYPGYGPAEGEASEESVNDNIRTAYDFLLSIGYTSQNIILMGYSIGTGPIIQLASILCDGPNPSPPGGVISIAGYLSIVDIVRDMRGSLVLSLLSNAIANRWNSGECIKKVTCPSLFIHGKRDEVIPCEHSEKLYENCASSKKVLHICPEANHSNFEEPNDTIHPIITFFHEFVKSKEKSKIIIVHPSFFEVPNTIRQKEEGRERQAQRESRYKIGNEVDESECGSETWTDNYQGVNCDPNTFQDFTDFMGWLFKDIADAFKSLSVNEKSTETDVIPLSFESHTEHGNQFLNSKGSPITKSQTCEKISLPTSPLLDLKEMKSKKSNAELKEDGISKWRKDIGDKKQEEAALLLLDNYVQALCNQDILRVVSYLDSEVLVRYPDSSRNWCTALRAYEKFSIMFSKMPSLKVKYEVVEVTYERNVTTILSAFQFSCEISGTYTTKALTFVIRFDKIILIEQQDP